MDQDEILRRLLEDHEQRKAALQRLPGVYGGWAHGEVSESLKLEYRKSQVAFEQVIRLNNELDDATRDQIDKIDI